MTKELMLSAAAGICLLSAIAAPSAAQSQQIATPEQGWSAIMKCRGIANDVQRHACTDDVLRRAGLMPTPQALEEERRREFGLQVPSFPEHSKQAASAPVPQPQPASSSAPPSPSVPSSIAPSSVKSSSAEVPTAPSTAVAPAIEHSAPQPSETPTTAATSTHLPTDNDRVVVTLAHVVLGGDGKLELTTQEGAVWKEVEDIPIRPTPRAGQAMAIRKTALGGFMCMPGKWRSFRCYRKPDQ